MKNICKIKFGSFLYGTQTPNSDLDLKAVYVPPYKDIILQKIQSSFREGPEKDGERERNKAGDVDLEGFALHKYLKLLAEGQTVSVDMLFAPDWAILEKEKEWDLIRENRERFLSSKSASFVGYCRTQANKYGIKGSRVYASRKMVEFLEELKAKIGGKEKVFLGEEKVREFLNSGIEHINLVEIPSIQNGRLIPHLECCNRKMPFFASINQCLDVFGRILKEYGERARLAEKNEGIDWKALSHAVRVGEEALELLKTGWIEFPRPNKEFLLKIKLGELGYKKVAEEIENLLELVEKAEQNSVLRSEPDKEFIENLIFEIYSRAYLS